MFTLDVTEKKIREGSTGLRGSPAGKALALQQEDLNLTPAPL